jgi:hypothetical protein
MVGSDNSVLALCAAAMGLIEILNDRDIDLEPIQEEGIHDERVGRVRRRSMMRIMARRKKAATVRA